MMQAVSQGSHPGKSSVTLLPMIDMNPSDMSCVYSTLKFVCSLANRHQITPVLTFDQPLWWKAQQIIANEQPDSDLCAIVLRVGGFHTEMSFLGSIGHIMAGSGLQEVLELVYAQNAVGHMLSGKAISRAVRGHLLVDSALNALLTAKTFSIDLPLIHTPEMKEQVDRQCSEAEPSGGVVTGTSRLASGVSPSESTQARVSLDVEHIPDDLHTTIQLYDKLIASEVSPVEVCEDQFLVRVQKKLRDQSDVLTTYPTARLWLVYMEMVNLLRQFLKAERTGNWQLHLRTLQEMLPYFAAAGHNLYTKSVHVYLQQMLQLEEHHPDVFASFTSGYHVIRRSDRYWAGLSPDLVIEQVLMRSMKTTGGLTRGRGMNESQRTQWLLSMPACAEMNSAMQELTDNHFMTSNQHKDMTKARTIRDEQDNTKLLGFLQERNPFDQDSSLRNIATGVTADKSVNADKAKEVGCKILGSMKGKNVVEYTFKKKRTGGHNGPQSFPKN